MTSDYDPRPFETIYQNSRALLLLPLAVSFPYLLDCVANREEKMD
jgi:hypothetical protein